MSDTAARPFDLVGGDKLRAVIRDFYDRVVADQMIGYQFAGKNIERLIQKEWELVARMLGNNEVRYTGRSMPDAHRHLGILGGHFERRLQILRETLADHDVPAEVREAWLKHTVSMRPMVTADRGSECDHEKSGIPANDGAAPGKKPL